jgi:hypothetical protein
MSAPTVYTWPALDKAAICALQTIGAAGNLIINGTLASAFHYPYDSASGPVTYAASSTTYALPSVTFPKISRTVSITSTGNLAGVNFTVTGIYQGSIVSQTIAGPNNSTVTTTQLFNKVTQVSVSGAVATNVSVGSGATGQTQWLKESTFRMVHNLSIQVAVSNANITYSFQTTLDEIQTILTPTVFTPIAAMTGATTNQLGNYTPPTNYSNIIITAATTGSLVATFLQQGIE